MAKIFCSWQLEETLLQCSSHITLLAIVQRSKTKFNAGYADLDNLKLCNCMKGKVSINKVFFNILAVKCGGKQIRE